ncbi:MAG: hypothetical protein A2Y10_12345 [Planctomycetes bacterium GWF2_41_51]|nr:MAG: hypothetical protein A2Y10_12345 [Planctomycetes bacterium GWF2_41_51]HBG26946.1 hypothetical protein [Phycisphaerales bacterium]
MTYGLESNRAKNINDIQSIGYSNTENQFSANFSGNNSKIQEDLAKIINRWPSLPISIKTAILILIGDKHE